MEHHSHAHHIHAVESLNVVYYIAIALNFGFVIVEALAGVYSNSTGLLSDAGHKPASRAAGIPMATARRQC